jgi:sulfatase maturation enzyme AslB (radical SAM superfamily)
LNQHDFAYDAIMATNAFLIHDEIIERAKNDWHMIAWNITVDGTEEVYNATKRFVTSCESPYRRVIRNIGKLLDAGFQVNIRMNLGVHNSHDLACLVDELYETFGNRDNLCVYCATLYERQLEELAPRSHEEEQIVRSKEKELYDKVVSLGLFKPRLSQELKVYRCNPDMGWAVSVLPDGRIGWCEDYVDKRIVSHIDSTEFDLNEIIAFKERYDDLPECSSCPLYPDCIRLKKCDIDTPWCTEYKREVRLHKIKTAMRAEYGLHKKQQS